MTTRRTIVVRLLLLLIGISGGAIVNVAVAWGPGARARLPRGGRILVTAEANELWRKHGKASPTRPVIASREESTLVTATWIGTNLFQTFEGGPVAGFEPASPQRYDILVVEMGWPPRGLRRLQSNVVSPTVLPGRRVPIHNHLRWLSEARPLWPGFAINTIFYAAILWLLFAAPGFIRKRRRIKRGLCPACAYPVGANELCTECGAKVKTHTPSPPGRGLG